MGVEQIAAAAGITRTRFYHYYKSKHEAYAALLHRISDEILEVYSRPDSWFAGSPGSRPREAMLATFEGLGEVWLKHGPVLREASDMWNAVPQVREHWQQIVAKLVSRTETAIDRERGLGAAPSGPDAHVLAQSLIWQGERLLFLALIGAEGQPEVDDIIEICASIWMRVIYLADDPDPR